MLRHRLNPDIHGSDGFTTVPRLVATAGLLIGVALGVQMALSGWYAGRIMPGVVAAGEPVGGLTIAQARGVLQQEAATYELKITVAGQNYRATPAQLGVDFDTDTTLATAYNTSRGFWPAFQPSPVSMSYAVDENQLASFSRSVADQVGVQPVDASVVWSGTKFQPVPDKSGVSIDHTQLEELIQQNLQAPDNTGLKLAPRPVAADIQVADLGPTIAEAKQLVATPIVLTYKSQNYTPTENDIGQWLAFVKQTSGNASKLVPQVDGAKLESYLQQLAKQLDVAPVTQRETVVNGVVNVQQAGVNGTDIDQNALGAAITAAVTAGQPLTYAITDYPVPFTTQSTNLVSLAGLNSYVEVNLKVQHLWVWQDGQVIYDSPVTSGATGAGFPTPTGLFSIYYKAQNVNLVGYQYGPRYDYSDFVQYWMPFYSGYGLHDASWRNGNFGETSGPFGYYYDGSHGCINLPLATAAFLYNWSVVGTPVWVHN